MIVKSVVCVCACTHAMWRVGSVFCGEKLGGKDFYSSIIKIMTGETKHGFEICLCV